MGVKMRPIYPMVRTLRLSRQVRRSTPLPKTQPTRLHSRQKSSRRSQSRLACTSSSAATDCTKASSERTAAAHPEQGRVTCASQVTLGSPSNEYALSECHYMKLLWCFMIWHIDIHFQHYERELREA